MNKSDSISSLAKALAKAQSEMSVAKKESKNPFFNSNYADLAAVVDAIKLPLSSNGLSYAQLCDIDDAGVVVETMLMHESGEWICSRLRMKPAKADPQGIGSCITYARRYGLQAIVGVPSDDDDGNAASGNEKNMTNKPLKAPHKPTNGAYEKLPENRKTEINDMAIEIIAYVADENIEAAVSICDSIKDIDEKVALWSLLRSDIRAKLKKFDEERKAA